MPQVYIILGPNVLKNLGNELVNAIGFRVMADVEDAFHIREEQDVALTIIEAVSIFGDTDIQIEIRYTAGEDEYGRGEPFNPSKKDQDSLITLVTNTLANTLREHIKGRNFSASVWCKPYYHSIYKRVLR